MRTSPALWAGCGRRGVEISRLTTICGGGRSPTSTGSGGAVWDFFEVRSRTPYEAVLAKRGMPGSVWFPGVELNYAEHMRCRAVTSMWPLRPRSEVRTRANMTYAELHREVASFAAGLRAMGVEKGDRVISLMPNIPETVVAFLATASIGPYGLRARRSLGYRALSSASGRSSQRC